jgi:hypothetical protein
MSILFAEVNPAGVLFVIVAAMAALGLAMFKVWLAVNRPEQYKAMKEQEERRSERRAELAKTGLAAALKMFIK